MTESWGESCAEILTRVRERAPLVHNIANYVAMDVAANVLLAIGASPAMVHAPEEVTEFVAISQALVVNIGTLSAPWVESMVAGARTASERGCPWVLDPVGAGATGFRNRTVERLLAHRPTVIRGNASEILAVAGSAGVPRGVDSVNTPEQARDAASALAGRIGSVVAVSGAIDLVTDGVRGIRLGNGDPLMTKVTALGCALSAVTGACLAVEPDPFTATAAAVAIFGVAGEIAASRAAGPASFRTAFIDALHAVDAPVLAERLRVVESW